MPCRDYYSEGEELRMEQQATAKLKKQNDKLTRMLCAITTTIEEEGELFHFLTLTNWKESGVTEDEYREWWRRHKIEDAKRKEREREDRERMLDEMVKEQKRKDALEKLTDEERKLLGVKK